MTTFLNIGFVYRDVEEEVLKLGMLDQDTYEIEDIISFPDSARDDMFGDLKNNELSIVEIIYADDFSQPLNPDIPDDQLEPNYFEDSEQIIIKEISTIEFNSDEFGDMEIDFGAIIEMTPEDFDEILLGAISDAIGE